MLCEGNGGLCGRDFWASRRRCSVSSARACWRVGERGREEREMRTVDDVLGGSVVAVAFAGAAVEMGGGRGVHKGGRWLVECTAGWWGGV